MRYQALALVQRFAESLRWLCDWAGPLPARRQNPEHRCPAPAVDNRPTSIAPEG